MKSTKSKVCHATQQILLKPLRIHWEKRRTARFRDTQAEIPRTRYESCALLYQRVRSKFLMHSSTNVVVPEQQFSNCGTRTRCLWRAVASSKSFLAGCGGWCRRLLHLRFGKGCKPNFLKSVASREKERIPNSGKHALITTLPHQAQAKKHASDYAAPRAPKRCEDEDSYVALGFTGTGEEQLSSTEVCHEVLSDHSMKTFPLRRHLKTRHADLCNRA